MLLQTLRGTNETFDFWEHAANVHQLMLHPTDPGNSLLAIHTPSAFFSPYLLAVALGAKLTGTGPVHALAAAGLVNYWLLIAGVWWFTRVFSRHRQAPFYALLFIWLLWGASPWKYSGFFNLRALSAVIAYPSTFATAIGMLTAALWNHTVEVRGRRQWVTAGVCTVGLAVVVLSHPVAAAATGSAMLAISLTAHDRPRALAALVVIGAIAAGLCIAWPYYSVTRLAGAQGPYDPGSVVLYHDWVIAILPAFAALVLFFYGTETLRRARLGLYCVPLIGLYIYGYASHHYVDGTTISYVVIGAQIGLADLSANLERPALKLVKGPALVLAAGAVALLFVAELYNMRGGLRGSLPGTGSAPPVYASYRPAVDGLPPSATVAAPLNDGSEAVIPVYAGRLIATHRPLAFVPDQLQRQRTVFDFFLPSATSAFRAQVIRRYAVRYIVVPASEPAVVAQLTQFGTVIRRTPSFETIAVSA